MKALALARTSLRRIMRDRVALFFTLLFPAIFVVVFGLAFGRGQSGAKPRTYTVVVARERGAGYWADLGRRVTQTLRDARYGDGTTPVFAVIDTLSSERALAALRARTVDAIVLVPRASAPPIPIAVHYSVADPDGPTVSLLVRSRVETLLGPGTPPGQVPLLTVVQRPLAGGGVHTPFDYVVPGMLIFALLGMQTGIVVELTRDVANGLLERLRLTRMTPLDYNIGRLLPWVVIGAVQTLFLIGVAHLFGFRMHGSWALTIALGAATATATFGSAYLVSAYARNERQASSLSTFITIPLSFYVGAFFPISAGPTVRLGGHTMGIRDLLPWSHMLTALRRVMLDGAGLRAVRWDLSWFAGTTLALASCAVWVFGKRRLRRD